MFTCFQGSFYYNEKASSSNKTHAKKHAVSYPAVTLGTTVLLNIRVTSVSRRTR
jgi:hypothetical protein